MAGLPGESVDQVSADRAAVSYDDVPCPGEIKFRRRSNQLDRVASVLAIDEIHAPQQTRETCRRIRSECGEPRFRSVLFSILAPDLPL